MHNNANSKRVESVNITNKSYDTKYDMVPPKMYAANIKKFLFFNSFLIKNIIKSIIQ